MCNRYRGHEPIVSQQSRQQTPLLIIMKEPVCFYFEDIVNQTHNRLRNAFWVVAKRWQGVLQGPNSTR